MTNYDHIDSSGLIKTDGNVARGGHSPPEICLFMKRQGKQEE